MQVLAERMRDINPAVRVEERLQFLVPEAAEELVLQQRGSFLVDCIDSVAPKVYLIAAAVKHGVPIISAMGAGGKVDPACVQVRAAFPMVCWPPLLCACGDLETVWTRPHRARTGGA